MPRVCGASNAISHPLSSGCCGNSVRIILLSKNTRVEGDSKINFTWLYELSVYFWYFSILIFTRPSYIENFYDSQNYLDDESLLIMYICLHKR